MTDYYRLVTKRRAGEMPTGVETPRGRPIIKEAYETVTRHLPDSVLGNIIRDAIHAGEKVLSCSPMTEEEFNAPAPEPVRYTQGLGINAIG